MTFGLIIYVKRARLQKPVTNHRHGNWSNIGDGLIELRETTAIGTTARGKQFYCNKLQNQPHATSNKRTNNLMSNLKKNASNPYIN